MISLTRGANTELGQGVVTFAFDWPTTAGAVDATAYLLTAAGKVRSDDDMVFFNQRSVAGGALALEVAEAGRAKFVLDPARLPEAIEKVSFCLTVETAGQTLRAFQGASLSVGGAGGPIASFEPDLAGASEVAMIMAEAYRRGGAWKVRAVGQGFNGGLAPLAQSFGVQVEEPAQAAPPPPPPPPPPPAPSSAPVSLAKITLDKARPTVSLEKRGRSFGSIIVNLNWTSSGGRSLFGRPKPVDLDLGCLVELADGRKGAVQALGGTFGALDQPPYIMLDRDDRTGALAGGETLRINGDHWADLRRVALYAFIYEGAPNWRSTDGLITITMPDQPPIEIAMNEGQDGRGFCGLALIENVGGTMKFTRLLEYYRSHKEYDERLGWGMRWTAGSK
jgi:tellurite resistance protein TerA